MKRIKQAFYRLAYRAASRLSDVSGGARLFVRWKVALAAVILGFSTVALSDCRRTSCYESPQPTCYDPVAPEQPCPETDGEKNARYDAGDPDFMEKADSAFTETPTDSTAK